MKVLHLQSGELSGGAARGTYCLHKAQRELGIDSHLMLGGRNDVGDPSVTPLISSNLKRIHIALLRRIGHFPEIFYRRRKNLIYNTGLIGLPFHRTKEYKEADVIHLHWINDLVSIKSLSRIKKPIVWTLRDMWPLTGGCHYAMDCKKYNSGCGACPQLGSSYKWDLSKLVMEAKCASFPRKIQVVGISEWLTSCAENSKVFDGNRIKTISNNIDVDDFYPIPKELARMSLGLKQKVKIVLSGALSLNDPWKGFDYYIDAVNTIPFGNIHLLLFGQVDPKILGKINHPVTCLGELKDTVSMRIAYSAADVFVAPSVIEAFGKTLAESMSCGTPVVCFDATGPRDIVVHKQTGYCAKPYDIYDLAKGIDWVLSIDKTEYKQLQHASRKRVIERFDAKIIAKKYLSLYEELLQ